MINNMIVDSVTKLKYLYQIVLLLVTLAILTLLFLPANLSAVPLTTRSVLLSASTPGELTTHTFTFDINSPVSLGSMEFEYCSNSPFIGTSCTAPTGFNLAITTFGSQAGETGFTIHPNTTANRLVIGRVAAPAASPIGVTYSFDSVTNPTDSDTSFFVRISTYASTDGTGVRGDTGAVVFSTSGVLAVGGYVPPYVTFCVGNTVATDCSSATGNYLNFGELSATTAKTATSQFAVATNDPTGYITYLSGLTLTSGNKTIPAFTIPGISAPGTSQFGLNLRLNSSPAVGAERTGVGVGVPEANFDTPNSFAFGAGALVASTLPTDFNVFTVSYLVNISAVQEPGIYSSTITYTTTVQF